MSTVSLDFPLGPERELRAMISYCQTDRHYVAGLALAAEEAGVRTWHDRRIQPGAPYVDQIENAIDEADVLLVVLSRAAAKSSWVRREIAYARQQRKLIAPLMIERCNVPLHICELYVERALHRRLPSQQFFRRLCAGLLPEAVLPPGPPRLALPRRPIY